MPTIEQLQAVMTGTELNRIEALRRLLAYPVKQLDPEGSRFWYLRPGEDHLEAADTLPMNGTYLSAQNLIYVGFRKASTQPTILK
jgi:hypothetical protein